MGNIFEKSIEVIKENQDQFKFKDACMNIFSKEDCANG